MFLATFHDFFFGKKRKSKKCEIFQSTMCAYFSKFFVTFAKEAKAFMIKKKEYED
jgi:hypothetical protein